VNLPAVAGQATGPRASALRAWPLSRSDS